MTNGKRIILAVGSGLLYVWGFAGFYLDALAWVALVPLFFAIRDTSPRRAFFLGWLAGFTAHVYAFYWVVRTIVVFGELPLPIALLAHVLLAAAQSAQFGVFAFLLIFCHREPEGRGYILKSSWFIISPIVWFVV
ncbi:MAG: hypothetical protein HY465_01555 [Deltaproteobacteria bacterium]|nr:hypothetical protein [Deltaproteobacteria bacterium]